VGIPILDADKIEKYLEEAEENALVSMAANKWERFGYWAAQSVHLRKILGLSRTPSPFRDFAELARKKINEPLATSGDYEDTGSGD